MGQPHETGNFETIYMFSWSTNYQLGRGTNLEKVQFLGTYLKSQVGGAKGLGLSLASCV